MARTTKAKKTAAKKPAAKKTTAKKTTAKKTTAKKTTAKKTTAKKTTAKKTTAKKTTAKKPAAKKPAAKKPAATASAAASGKTVDGYIATLAPWQATVVRKLRKIVKGAAPMATEAVKWAQPVYESNGPLCYIRAFASTVNIGFWRGGQLTDPKGVLAGEGKQMKHIKVTSAKDVDAQILTKFVKQAVKLNALEGNPTKR